MSMVNRFTGVEQSEPTKKNCSTEECIQFQAVCVNFKLFVHRTNYDLHV